jgi:hypothetical protein
MSQRYPLNRIIQDSSGHQITITTSGFLNIHNADAHEILVNELAHLCTGSIQTLTAAASLGDVTVAVTSGGFYSANDVLEIRENGTKESLFHTVTSINGNSLILDMPLDHTYTTSAVAETVIVNIASVAGTLASPVTFVTKPFSGATWHITRMNVAIEDDKAGSDDKFGGESARTYGIVIRENKSNGTEFTSLTNWKSNGDMIKDTGIDLEYHQKGAGGNHGVRARWTLKRADAISKLVGANGDQLEFLIQDDMTDLISTRINIQGHFEIE